MTVSKRNKKVYLYGTTKEFLSLLGDLESFYLETAASTKKTVLRELVEEKRERVQLLMHQIVTVGGPAKLTAEEADTFFVHHQQEVPGEVTPRRSANGTEVANQA